jgi:SsrA-binding protein
VAKTGTAGVAMIALNRRASYDYELEGKYEAGLALSGSEVKMLRMGKADLSDAWVELKGREAWLRGLNVPAMDHSPFSHEPKRTRKLLLHEREIEELARGIDRNGMTVIATKLYFKGRIAKVEIALARGKKKADKRESMREKDAEKEARAAMNRARRG